MEEFVYELAVVPIITGLFAVVGGIIPLVAVLYIIFLLIRDSFRELIESEPERIAKYKEMLQKQRELQQKFEAGLEKGELRMTPEISEAMSSLSTSIYESEMEVLLREVWIERVRKASFLNWIRHHFGKRYFEDYFRK